MICPLSTELAVSISSPSPSIVRSLSCDLFVLSAGLSLGCVPSPASSTGHLKLSDDHITLLVKAHGRAAKAFSDAGAPAAAVPLYAAAVRCWDELGDTARLQSTVPDVGYTLFAWAAKLVRLSVHSPRFS